MILSTGAELTWKQFIQQPQYKDLSLNEQVIAYDKYLTYLSNLRNSNINFQNKGILVTSKYVPSCVEGMDVVFLIDYTASMGDEIDALKLNISSIVQTIITESGGDYRLGLVIFDEYNGQGNTKYGTNVEYTSLPAAQRYVNYNAVANKSQWITALEVMSISNNPSFTTQLNKLNNTIELGAGAGGPEPGGIGFQQILNGITGEFRSNVSKLVILITDAQPGGDDDFYDATDDNFLHTVGTAAGVANVRALVLSQRNNLPNRGYRILANDSGGSFTQDSNLSPTTIIQIIQDICS